MKRNIVEYESEYQQLAFEQHQAALRREKLLDFLEIQSNTSRVIVEVGCGMQPLFTDFSQFRSMTVIEPSTLFYNNARELAVSSVNASSISVLNLQLEEASLKEKADIVIVAALLHEVNNAGEFLAQARRLGKPDCLYVFIVPNAKSLHRQLAFRCDMISSLVEISDTQKRLQQHRTYSVDSLSVELTQAGFDIIDSTTIIPKPFTHSQMQALLDHQILTQEQLYTFCKMEDLFPNLGSEIFLQARLGTD